MTRLLLYAHLQEVFTSLTLSPSPHVQENSSESVMIGIFDCLISFECSQRTAMGQLFFLLEMRSVHDRYIRYSRIYGREPETCLRFLSHIFFSFSYSFQQKFGQIIDCCSPPPPQSGKSWMRNYTV